MFNTLTQMARTRGHVQCKTIMNASNIVKERCKRVDRIESEL